MAWDQLHPKEDTQANNSNKKYQRKTKSNDKLLRKCRKISCSKRKEVKKDALAKYDNASEYCIRLIKLNPINHSACVLVSHR